MHPRSFDFSFPVALASRRALERMLNKWGWNALLVPLVILNGGMLAVELVMLRAGSGSLNNPQKEPSYYPGWYAVIVSDMIISTKRI